MNLSKTKFCIGVQCPKILWLDANARDKFDESVIDKSRIETGLDVGDLARKYFADVSTIPSYLGMSGMLRKTRRLLESETSVIAEAAFRHGGNYCIVDILRKLDDGYEIVEVKSSTEIKPHYLHDMAYQAFVLKSCSIPVKKVSLMLVNNQYVRQGELDLQQMFVIHDCTARVMKLQSEIPAMIAEIERVFVQESEPQCDIGGHCDSPHQCGYKAHCFRGLPKNNVFDIGFSMRAKIKESAYKSGIVSFDNVLNSGIPLTTKQRRQITATLNDSPPHINKTAIREFLDTVKYPLYHLDFETMQSAIPLWDNARPYEQIPTQYSIHIQDKPFAEPTHREFLAEHGSDPRRALAERLCADIPPNSCVIAYNSSFEKMIIRGLAELFPDLSAHLLSFDIIDLAEPFKSGAYYHREMGGSYSIKKVLPALCPPSEYPELDYKSLVIQNGSMAMNAFAENGDKSAVRTALLEYCRLDTFAMVRILGKLYEVVKL